MNEEVLKQLFDDFQNSPLKFFHEREIHSHFFNLAREHFGVSSTNDRKEVHRLRYEYNSIWRYQGTDRYMNRYSDLGNTLELDFAVLREDFIEKHSYLEVVNKAEPLRAPIRDNVQNGQGSPTIEIGIEFKMRGFRTCDRLRQGEVNSMKSEMLQDCRKLAHERVDHGYIVSFIHGPLPDRLEANRIMEACVGEFRRFWHDGKIHVFIVSPLEIFVSDQVLPMQNVPAQDLQLNAEIEPPPNETTDQFFGNAKIVRHNGQLCHLTAWQNGSYTLRYLQNRNWGKIAEGQQDIEGFHLLVDAMEFVEDGPTNIPYTDTAYWRGYFDCLSNHR